MIIKNDYYYKWNRYQLSSSNIYQCFMPMFATLIMTVKIKESVKETDYVFAIYIILGIIVKLVI